MTDKQIIIEDYLYFIGGNCQEYLDGFTKTGRNKIKKLPNFDKNIFKEIKGIEV